MNIPVAHTQGGEVTGSIDESVRHAITKLSHIHFTASDDSYNRVIKLGEDVNSVFNTGCPAMDLLIDVDLTLAALDFKYGGLGAPIDWTKPYVLVVQHPVTTEYESSRDQIIETIEAIQSLGMQTIWLWPNIDAGSDEISKAIREYRELKNPMHVRFFKNFSALDYAIILNNAACLIGNSSSFIREGSFLGVPAVCVGTRQGKREHGDNIIFCGYDRVQILDAVTSQIVHGRYPAMHIFGDGQAGKRIADILYKYMPNIQKNITY
jgi:UDP-hydrolysing UDP-N-acetyl-D-glucosamine 2-epimerase